MRSVIVFFDRFIVLLFVALFRVSTVQCYTQYTVVKHSEKTLRNEKIQCKGIKLDKNYTILFYDILKQQ